MSNITRFYFRVQSSEQWYAIIGECNRMFGKEWSGKKKVRKALEQFEKNNRWNPSTTNAPEVWFDVPSETFGTFIAIKFGLQVEMKS